MKFALLLSLFVLGSASAETKPSKIIPYKKVGDVELKLHVFNPNGHKASDSRPAIVFFFGGGDGSVPQRAQIPEISLK